MTAPSHDARASQPDKPAVAAHVAALKADAAQSMAGVLAPDKITRLWWQIDRLNDTDEWDARDLPLHRESLRRFLWFVVRVKPEDWPSLGMTHEGYLLASWDRVTITFAPDRVVVGGLGHTSHPSHPSTPTGLTLLERLDMISWDLTRGAAAKIRELEAALTAANGAVVRTCAAYARVSVECDRLRAQLAGKMCADHPLITIDLGEKW